MLGERGVLDFFLLPSLPTCPLLFPSVLEVSFSSICPITIHFRRQGCESAPFSGQPGGPRCLCPVLGKVLGSSQPTCPTLGASTGGPGPTAEVVGCTELACR